MIQKIKRFKLTQKIRNRQQRIKNCVEIEIHIIESNQITQVRIGKINIGQLAGKWVAPIVNGNAELRVIGDINPRYVRSHIKVEHERPAAGQLWRRHQGADVRQTVKQLGQRYTPIIGHYPRILKSQRQSRIG